MRCLEPNIPDRDLMRYAALLSLPRRGLLAPFASWLSDSWSRIQFLIATVAFRFPPTGYRAPRVASASGLSDTSVLLRRGPRCRL